MWPQFWEKTEQKIHGAVIITDGKQQLGEMKIGISNNVLIIYHTEVLPTAEGKGLGKKLLTTVVDYARNNALKVKTFCIFVYAQFKRYPEKYIDVWKHAP